ncbi:Pre-mRNA-splicing factor Cwf15/Cwc15 [Polychytrium aggregatum]|uniref:Pre-mRNA-splicing factor Cwf15/Cwc15 n=1 Tax=Polychytrium aggregatum TaxID=110093 RepID=UPI0022FE9DA3|nr:Pre-mRNA-splicing factor Cwf15/Cwc15 [Polychytrium aggregatum]KAI9199476.1 Pre-mRNA-splicing factor Cwf15/Cwc15 [Polychytrium aggregatum]
MTTAARPTWLPAVGGNTLRDTGKAPLRQVSSRDLAAHTKMKLRQPGQNAPEDLDRDEMRSRLLDAEGKHFQKTKKKHSQDEDDGLGETSKRQRIEEANIDADDTDDDFGESADERSNDDDDDDDDNDDDDDDDDDTAELMRELEKIKKERQEEKERQEREEREVEQRKREEEALTGNPLLASSSSSLSRSDFSVKKRWDDDVIFKNQARSSEGAPKRFINDMLRSDFHKKFMNKYVK